MQDTKGKVILSLLAGATAGLVAGLLLAPETGDETRASLKKSASKLTDDLSKLLKDGLERANSVRTAGAEPEKHRTDTGKHRTDTEKHRTDQAAADDLLKSLASSRTEADPAGDADSDYDGIGGDARHSAGYGH